jgi:hypothetical protein
VLLLPPVPVVPLLLVELELLAETVVIVPPPEPDSVLVEAVSPPPHAVAIAAAPRKTRPFSRTAGMNR